MIFRRVMVQEAPGRPCTPVLLTGDVGHTLADIDLTATPFPTLRRPGSPAAAVPLETVEHGEVLCTAPAPAPSSPWPVPWQVRVASGPAAGRCFPLGPGRHLVGRGGVDLTLPEDTYVSREHLLVDVSIDEVRIEEAHSSNGTLHEGKELEGIRTWAPGEAVRVGDSLLTLVRPDDDLLPLDSTDDGHLLVHPRHRPTLAPLPTGVEIPARPSSGGDAGTPWVQYGAMLVSPLAFGGVMFVVTGRALFLFLGLIGPIVMLLVAITGSRSRRRRQERDEADYRAAVAAAEQQLDVLLRREAAHLRADHPDPATLVDAAERRTRAVWTARPGSADVLVLRVGVADQPSRISVRGRETPQTSWLAPVTVSLREVDHLAVVGPRARARAAARALVLQAAVLHPPSLLRLYLITDSTAEDCWGWVRWLPHARLDSDDPVVRVGSDERSREERIAELRATVELREQLADRRDPFGAPPLLVVVDGVDRASVAALSVVFQRGPAVGVHVVTVDERIAPESCRAVLSLDADSERQSLSVAGAPDVAPMLVDAVPAVRCEAAARSLAPLLVGSEVAGTELPRQLRLLDLLGLDDVRPEDVQLRWKTAGGGYEVPLGAAEGAGAWRTDITAGPHTLVAGTTRSGKSEFLKTLVASLAVHKHPEDMQFLFIDFKGPNDFRLCSALPHAVALATQQDIGDFRRTMALLSAEVDRRTRLCERAQVANVVAYRRARRADGALPPLPRLLVIVDEFADFARQHPEELERLVTLARTGAAFGVHLLLAAQSPEGVVSGQIDANVGLRVCFRTAKAEGSTALLGRPVAAHISRENSGRAFELFEGKFRQVQSARVAGARPGRVPTVEASAEIEAWQKIGWVPGEERREDDVPDSATDLAALVGSITEAAESAGWTRGVIPWSPALGTVLPLDDVPPPELDNSVVIGAWDDVGRQRHSPLEFTFGTGHLAVAGGPASGRSTTLRTLAAAACSTFSASDLHLYVCDFAGTALTGLGRLPHCAVLAARDDELAARALDRLEVLLAERRSAFHETSAATLPEHNRSARSPLPWLMLLVDGWEVLQESTTSSTHANASYQRWLRLLADGTNYGLVAAIAGDRRVALHNSGRVMSHRFVLRMNQSDDYTQLDLRQEHVPSAQPPGNVVLAGGALGQVAVLADGTGAGENRALHELVDRIRERDADILSDRLPRTMRALPDRWVLGKALEETSAPGTASIPALLGRGATRDAVWVDLAAVGPLVVSARPGKGRTSALVQMAEVACAAGVAVYAITPRENALSRFARAAGAGVASTASEVEQVLATGGRPLLVVVDDAEELAADDPGLLAALRTARSGSMTGVVVAGNRDFWARSQPGWSREARSGDVKLILSPMSPYDGEHLGAGKLASEHVFDGPPGRALLVNRSERDIVQIPCSGA